MTGFGVRLDDTVADLSGVDDRVVGHGGGLRHADRPAAGQLGGGVFGPTQRLDIEAEAGFVVGVPAPGSAPPTSTVTAAGAHAGVIALGEVRGTVVG